MARYIDADKIKSKLQEKSINSATTFINTVLMGLLDDEPTADVVEAKYGKWEKRKTIIFDSVKVGYNCSECNTTWDTGTLYCPNCGAKMDDERKCDK
jgi:rubrerythrin